MSTHALKSWLKVSFMSLIWIGSKILSWKLLTCFEFGLPNTSAHSITAKKATITRNARAKSQQPDTAGSAGSVSLGSLNWAAAAHLVTNYLWVVGCSLGCCVALVAACLGLPLLLQWCGDGTTRRATQFVAAAAAAAAASRVELRSKLRNISLMQFSPGGNSPVVRFILEKTTRWSEMTTELCWNILVAVRCKFVVWKCINYLSNHVFLSNEFWSHCEILEAEIKSNLIIKLFLTDIYAPFNLIMYIDFVKKKSLSNNEAVSYILLLTCFTQIYKAVSIWNAKWNESILKWV